VFCRTPSRSSELRAARCPMTPSAAIWRKLCVDLPSAASTSEPPLGCSPVPPMSTATPTIRRRMSGSIGNSHRSNAHAPPAGTRLFYLATPPSAFAPISRHLGRSGIAREEDGAWRRLIVEKPFGTDLASAQALNRELLGLLEEHQIYRIDHYLGKETVQNILVLRFANGLFEPIWNRDHIDHVQITVAETLTVGRRGRIYDSTGAFRDMVPNHLFQLLSLVAMEPPSRFEAQAVRSEKAEALDAVHVPSAADALRDSVRAQYVAARVGDNEVEDYRRTAGVSPDSTT